jgi:hypothetical protein
VVARDDEQRPAEAPQHGGGRVVLVAPTAVREVAARDHEIGREPPAQLEQRRVRVRRLASPDVQIGDVENACRHRRNRLYSVLVANGEGPEIFDDLYLGVRAGGAMRKQRRGEELTEDEKEALGRWQRLSLWRKSVAIGAFAVGTFGLGFTLGGLVFGRWRKA